MRKTGIKDIFGQELCDGDVIIKLFLRNGIYKINKIIDDSTVGYIKYNPNEAKFDYLCLDGFGTNEFNLLVRYKNEVFAIIGNEKLREQPELPLIYYKDILLKKINTFLNNKEYNRIESAKLKQLAKDLKNDIENTMIIEYDKEYDELHIDIGIPQKGIYEDGEWSPFMVKRDRQNGKILGLFMINFSNAYKRGIYKEAKLPDRFNKNAIMRIVEKLGQKDKESPSILRSYPINERFFMFL
jgi:hypothetical protein